MRRSSFAFLFALFLLGTINAQCYYVPSTSSNTDTVTYSFSGGSFQSYGCAPIDPTRWLSGSGMSVTMTFTNPENYPMIRVWGMNDDDVASVTVNGNPYTMNYSSATYLPKVVCGLSPGPDGVYFIGGNIVGSNTNSQGNYSYSDVMILTTGVNTITVTGQAGAGWGFAGVSVNCDMITSVNMPEPLLTTKAFPNPAEADEEVYVHLGAEVNNTSIFISDVTGKIIYEMHNVSGTVFSLSPGVLTKGVYFIQWRDDVRQSNPAKLIIQ